MALPPLPIAASDIKALTPGLDAWYQAAEASAFAFDDDAIANMIYSRIRDFEMEAQFRIQQVQVYSAPDGTYDQTQAMPTFQEDGYPYFQAHGREFMVTTLRQRPIQQVQRLRFMLNGQSTVFAPPTQWFGVDRYTGRFQLVPVANAQLSAGVVAMSQVLLMFADKKYIPNFLFFDYIAGLTPGWQDTWEWQHLKLGLIKWCAVTVLENVAEAINAGKDSKQVSVAGASQGWTYSRFRNRLDALRQDAQRFLETFRAQNTPILMDVF